MAQQRFILSIDGGGIRGLIPALVLQELEGRLRKLGKNEPLYRYFDLIAGTSTGGIIAAGLTIPKPTDAKQPACAAADLVRLYEETGPKIFDQSLFNKIRSLDGFAQERYAAAPLEAKLRELLGSRRISEALTTLVLTAYDIENRKAAFLTNGPQLGDKVQPDYLAWQAARATSAAPTYFEPAYIENLRSKNREHSAFIDGGVFANDPGMAAVIEGKKQGWHEDDLFIVSLGTGRHILPIHYEDARNWGVVGWILPSHGTPIISVLMDGEASTVSYQLGMLFNKPPRRYLRLDCDLNAASDDLDDAREINLLHLRADADNLIRAESAILDQIAHALTPRPST